MVNDPGIRIGSVWPRRWFVAFFALLILPNPGAWAQGGPRIYKQGPLSFREFLAAPPAGVAFDAETNTHLKYDYRYRTLTRGGSTTFTLTKITFRAELDPAKSWTKRPQDVELLRHEQGHFDITEVIQRKAALEWQSQIGKLSIRASSMAEGKKEFDQLIRQRMEPYLQRLVRFQKQYDVDTNHGRNAERQKQWQQVLARLLENPEGAFPLAPEAAPAPGLNPTR